MLATIPPQLPTSRRHLFPIYFAYTLVVTSLCRHKIVFNLSPCLHTLMLLSLFSFCRPSSHYFSFSSALSVGTLLFVSFFWTVPVFTVVLRVLYSFLWRFLRHCCMLIYFKFKNIHVCMYKVSRIPSSVCVRLSLGIDAVISCILVFNKRNTSMDFRCNFCNSQNDSLLNSKIF